jgi:hypothetical protein
MSDTTDPERERRVATNELITRLWDLGNLITGFCTLQFLAFLAVTYTGGSLDRERILSQYLFIFLAVVIFIIFFAGSVWFCHRKEGALRIDAGHSDLVQLTSRYAAYGRLVWIAMFGLLVIVRVAHHFLHH